MNKNLQELTDRIYQEGIEKAQTERDVIVDKAKMEARKILSDANSKAEEIVRHAGEKAAELRQTNESEMRLASRQAIGALKQRIADLIIADVLDEPLEKAFDDVDFMQRLLERMIERWLESGADEDDVQVILPSNERPALREFFYSKGATLLEKGLKVEYSGVMKDGFVIGPTDGRYKISFTSDDFENYFRSFMRPRLIKLLYGEDS